MWQLEQEDIGVARSDQCRRRDWCFKEADRKQCTGSGLENGGTYTLALSAVVKHQYQRPLLSSVHGVQLTAWQHSTRNLFSQAL